MKTRFQFAAFISEYVEQKAQSRLPSRKSIFLSGGYKDREIAKQITQNNIVELNHLFSTQEEADTRIILHAADFCNVASRIIVRQIRRNNSKTGPAIEF